MRTKKLQYINSYFEYSIMRWKELEVLTFSFFYYIYSNSLPIDYYLFSSYNEKVNLLVKSVDNL